VVDDAVQRRLDAALLLLVVAVSLLAGLVVGATPGARVGVAAVSFVLVGAVLVLAGVFQSSGE
jgi:hypothetical protein